MDIVILFGLKEIHRVAVLDSQKSVVGIVSQTDIVQFLSTRGSRLKIYDLCIDFKRDLDWIDYAISN
jgi:hypothetical protein